MYHDIPEELRILIEPVVADAGLELVDVVLARGGRPWNLRITVDTPIGDGRVPVDHCARVAREIGTQLDVADAIESAYRLEVSSPGLDRVLAREKDFINACGSEVQVETKSPVAGRRRFRGALLSFEEGTVIIDVDGCESAVPFSEVAKARMIYQFSAADFSDGKSGNKTDQKSDGRPKKNRSGTHPGGKRSHGNSGEKSGKTAERTSGRTAEING